MVYGVETCEDTAITRDRLRALEVPYRYVDLDTDPEATAWVRAQHDGARITPTLRLGPEPDPIVVAEPTIERLEALVAQGGHPVRPIRALELHGAAAERPLPVVTVTDAGGSPWRTDSSRAAWLVAFLHGPSCRVCEGWAHQVAARAASFEEVDARPVFVLPVAAADLGPWREELAGGPVVVSDPDGAWRTAVAERLAAPPQGVLLVVADRYLAPRGWLFDQDAGGLVSGDELVAWGRLLQAECPECGGEVDWPTPTAS